MKCVRLGKFSNSKNRPIKVELKCNSDVMLVLRNKKKLTDGVNIQSDSTPMQRDYLKKLREKLSAIQESGDTGKTIRFINKVPKIVDVSKNIRKDK